MLIEYLKELDFDIEQTIELLNNYRNTLLKYPKLNELMNILNQIIKDVELYEFQNLGNLSTELNNYFKTLSTHRNSIIANNVLINTICHINIITKK